MIFKALADPNRLRVLDTLMEGESCNCELTEWLGLTPSLLSHHLRVLREAGLVTTRRDAVDSRWIYYAVDREAVARWRGWFTELFNPDRIKNHINTCGPEGQLLSSQNGGVPNHVLFLCTGNSCRSQIAEAIVNTRLVGRWQAASAGITPQPIIHPMTVAALSEIGINWQSNTTKPTDYFKDQHFDLVITLCNESRRELPGWIGSSVHLEFNDPVRVTGSEDEVMRAFREVRDAIAEQIPAFLVKWSKVHNVRV